jgi:hypothetical protein
MTILKVILSVILGLIILISLSSFIRTKQFESTYSKERETLETTQGEAVIITQAMIDDLEEPLKSYIEDSNITPGVMPKTLTLKQSIKLALNPNDPYKEASAIQTIGLIEPSFHWAVTVDFAPFMKVYGHDYFIEGEALLSMRLLNLVSVGKDENHEALNESAMQRYLLEGMLYPMIVFNPYVSYEVIDSTLVKLSIDYQGIKTHAYYHFDQEGTLIKTSAMRYKEPKVSTNRTNCIGDILAYETFNGYTLPSELEVTWALEEDFTWFKATITDAIYKD